MGIQINGQTDTISAVDGSITVATDLTVPGALTYDDVTNIDSVGIITARNGLKILAGGANIVGTTTITHAEVTTAQFTGSYVNVDGNLDIADSIRHLGDSNTKIRFPAADTITAETAGIERLRVTSAGLVGIGTDDPQRNLEIWNASESNLRINGGADYFEFRVKDSDNALTIHRNIAGGGSYEDLRISSAGNIGIGENNPAAKLDVKASQSNTVDIRLRNTESNAQMSLYAFGGSAAIGSHHNNRIAMMSWNSTEGIDIITNGTGDNDFRVYTAGYGTNSERLRVDSDGRVIIGTNSGSSNITLKLQGHSGSSTQDAKIRLCRGSSSPSDGNQLGAIFFSDNSESPSADIIAIRDGGTWSGSSKPGALKFSTTADGATSTTERLRITSAGQVIVNGTTNLGHPNMDDIIVGNASGNRGITVASGSSGFGTLAFGDSTDGSGNDRYQGFVEYYHNDDSMRLGTVAQERVRITSEGRVHLGNGGHGTTSVGGQEISGQNYSALLKLYDTRANIWGMQMRRDTGTGPNGIFVRAGNTSSNYSLFVCGTNESDNHLVCRGDGKVGIKTKDPAEHLHISGAVRRDTPGSSNIKFLEFSFELPSGSTTTIATVTGPVVSSMAIAKFEYVGLYDYADVGFYSGVEMASLRRSNSNSAYTYLQNSEIHAGGNNSNYQPNMFWQNGSNNTSDLMITTGSYVIIMGTIRITTYNLGLTRVISI